MDTKSINLHLIEIRNRSIKCVLLFIVSFAAIYPFAGQLFDLAASPILLHLPEGSKLIATEVTSPFFMPLKLDFYLSLLICMPFFAYHAWGFIGPALLKCEKKFLLPVSIMSIGLFYFGFALSYFVVLPELFKFFVNVAPSSVSVMTDMAHLLRFITNTSIIIGLICQISVILLVIVKFRIVNRNTLCKARRYAVLGAFIISMMIAPDVLFQFVFAGPIYFMYELGILLSKFVEPKNESMSLQESLA